jgi:serine/threonine protein phosphatase PrpC
LSSLEPPTWGRPSPATAAPLPLRAAAEATSAAYRADGGDLPGLQVRAATVAGLRHRLAGGVGEDAYAWAVREGWLVVTVADGVGSTPGAGDASAAAVRAACRAALDGAGGEDGEGHTRLSAACRRAATAASEAVREVAERGPEGRTTLVVAVMDAAHQLGEWASLRVGDSSGFELRARKWREVFAAEEHDEPLHTTTPALPSGPDTFEEATGTLEPGDALVLLTDGVADPLRDGPETVAPPLADSLSQAPSPLTLAAVADFARQGCLDDRTVLAVWRVEVDEQPSTRS